MKDRILPFQEDQVSVDSYDVRLSNHFYIFNFDEEYNKITQLDQFKPDDKNHWKEVVLGKEQNFYIKPKSFILASTIEFIDLSYEAGEDIYAEGCFSARLEGKSSIARNGIIIHSAGHIEPGFKGNITLEIYNQLPVPVSLTPGQLIGQLVIEAHEHQPIFSYSESKNHYMGQIGTTISASYNSKNMFQKTGYDFETNPFDPKTEN